MISFLRLLLLCSALCLLGGLVRAQGSGPSVRVVIVSSDTAVAYAQAAQAVVDTLVRQGVARSDISQVFASELVLRQQSGLPLCPAVCVALGSEATRVLLAGPVKSPVVSALIPRRSFERLLRSSGKAGSALVSAIYLDQPLARQLALVRLALPQARRLAVVLGPESSAFAANLRVVAAAHEMSLQDVTVNNLDDLAESLPQLLAQSDVLLALADPLVFNSSTIQNILLSSFRARVPMVAFSPAYVRAGALLALYTTPVQAGQQAAEVVLGLLRGRPLPDRAMEPNDFEVGVNTQVARSLGWSFDVDVLRQALRRQERLP